MKYMYYRPKSYCCFLTLGNVVRGSQSYANEILTAASGHDLHALHRMSTNLLSWYLLCSQRENLHLGKMVLNSFHFYTIWNRWMNELGFLRPFNRYADGREFDPKVRQNSLSLRFGHGKKSTIILSLLLIQKGQLSVTGERMGTKYW